MEHHDRKKERQKKPQKKQSNHMDNMQHDVGKGS